MGNLRRAASATLEVVIGTGFMAVFDKSVAEERTLVEKRPYPPSVE